MLILTQVFAFAVAFWLGFYLIGRDPMNRILRDAGLGLIAYSAVIAADMLGTTDVSWLRLQWGLVLLPALFWTFTMLDLLPDDSPWRRRSALWRGLGIVAIVGAAVLLDFSGDDPEPGVGYSIFAGLAALLLAAILALVAASRQITRAAWGILFLATLFFSLGAGVLVLPFDWIPRTLMMLAIGLDLVLFGVGIALFDAFEQGEALRLDMARSGVASGGLSLIFGGQIGMVMVIDTGVTTAMTAALLTTVGAAILIQTQMDWIGRGLDRVVFRGRPDLQQNRDELRVQSSTLLKTKPEPALNGIDEDEFVRLTRRALSNYGNLPRLATSPLTKLPLIDERLAQRAAPDNTLERAAELKAVLTEGIERLKPRNQGAYGTSDEWRHYNVLHYPYVLGLKPFSLRGGLPDEEGARAVLAWFRAQVPERTFYNWQKAAAKLVALDLWERE